LFGDMITAEQAAEWGMINRVLPDAEVDKFVDTWAARLAAGPSIAQMVSKQLLNASFERSMSAALDAEAAAHMANLLTDDVREAGGAWLDRRPPKFTGRSPLQEEPS